MKTEMERIREREVRIFPIVVTRTTTWVVEWLERKLLRPEDGKPLQAFKMSARNDEMTKIVSEVIEITSPTVAPNPGSMPKELGRTK